MKLIILNLVLGLFSLSTHAGLTEGKSVISLVDKSIVVRTVAGFHLNEKAPSRLVETATKKTIMPEKKAAKEFVFSLKNTESKDFFLEYFVCDDARTTCERHRDGLTIENTKLIIKKAPILTAIKLDSQASDLDEAMTRANKEKKLLLVDFSAPWCPACLRLETEVFPEIKFQKSLQNFVMLTLNLDLEKNKDLVSKYKVNVIPTLIIMDAHGNELSRIVDFHTTEEMVALMSAASSNAAHTKSYEQHLTLAQKGDIASMKHLAKRSSEMFNLKEASTWFKKLNEQSLLAAAADIGSIDSKDTTALTFAYKKYISLYPESFDSIVWRIELARVLLENKENKKQALTLLDENIVLINKALNDKKIQEKLFRETAQGLFTSFEKEELYSKLLDTAEAAENVTISSSALKSLQQTLAQHPLKATHSGEVLMAIDYMKAAKMNSEVANWFELLMASNPLSDLYPRKLARFYFQLKDYTRALPVAEKAVSLGKSYLFFDYLILAEVQKALGNKAAAAATAEKALNMPESKEKKNKNYQETLLAIKS